MTTRAISSPSSPRQKVNLGRIWVAGPAAIAAAVIANLIALFVLKAVLPLPADFPPLTAGAITFLTAVGALLAVIVYAVLARVSARPVTVFTWVAWVALIVSILPNLMLVANPTAIPFPFPGASALAFGVLIVFHVIAALACIILLPRLTARD